MSAGYQPEDPILPMAFEKTEIMPGKLMPDAVRLQCPECGFKFHVGTAKLYGEWGGSVVCQCCGVEGRVDHARGEEEAEGIEATEDPGGH